MIINKTMYGLNKENIHKLFEAEGDCLNNEELICSVCIFSDCCSQISNIEKRNILAKAIVDFEDNRIIK